jgi:Methylamine dehydrogenase, L chain
VDESESNVPLDRLTREAVIGLSQTSDRRGFLARVGKYLLTICGVTIVPLLPVDRLVEEARAADCSDWRLCGIYGHPCDCCVGGSLTGGCPGTLEEGAEWVVCCTNPTDNSSHLIAYIDCCNVKGHPPPVCDLCGSCYNNSQQPAWCPHLFGKLYIYGCTFITVGESC